MQSWVKDYAQPHYKHWGCTCPFLQVEEITPTVGFSVEQVKLEKCKLTIVDLSGDKRYHKLWSCYYEEAQVFSQQIDNIILQYLSSTSLTSQARVLYHPTLLSLL